ncbi:MAG: MFS transporter, partial [Nitrospiraceae bacterium]
MLMASRWLAWLKQGDFQEQMRIISGSMAVGGMAVCGLSLLGPPILAGVLIIVIGGTTALFTPIVWSVLQEMTPGHLIARVITTFSTGGLFSAM